MAVNVLIF